MALWAALALALLAYGAHALPCDGPSLAAQRYCVHCGDEGTSPTICVAAGGKACTYTYTSEEGTEEEWTVELCSGQSPGAADGTCFATVNDLPLYYRAEPWLVGGEPLWQRYETCADKGADACKCTGTAKGYRTVKSPAFYYQRACATAPAVYGAAAGPPLPACTVVIATGRQRVSDCLPEAPTCFSEVQLLEAGELKRYWVPDHVCTQPAATVLSGPNDPLCGKPLRLVGGYNKGRLEVMHNGVWGTVCDSRFSDREADVVCRQLNLPTPGRAIGAAFHGPGTGPIHLAGADCTAFQNRLVQCNAKWGVPGTCTHAQDVGVQCASPPVQVRLVSGAVINGASGRLEVNVNGLGWGSVCAKVGNSAVRHDELANVVCRQLGKGTPGRIIGGAAFGPGLITSPIWLDSWSCDGTERRLDECSHGAWKKAATCTHNEDISIQCGAAPMEVRLADGGDNPAAGRLEIRFPGVPGNAWGTVCNARFTDLAAAVVCNQLGFRRQGTVVPSGTYGTGSGPIWSTWTECMGRESRLDDCDHKIYGGAQGCDHSTDVNIECATEDPPAVELRLVGGFSENSGRLDVNYDGVWGTVCAEGFDDNDATVAGRAMGLPTPCRALGGVFQVADEQTPVHLTYLACDGSEDGLEQCPHWPWSFKFCPHAHDVGIECPPTPGYQSQARLVAGVNGNGKTSGRVELDWMDGRGWGTIAGNAIDDNVGLVLCKMIPGVADPWSSQKPARVIGGAYFGIAASGPILLQDVTCTGYELDIHSCYRGTLPPTVAPTTTKADTVGVICDAPPVRLRLMGAAAGVPAGRLEIQADGKTWGTVCGDSFGDLEATVACRDLGLPTPGRVLGAQFGPGAATSPIWLESVSCSGNEKRIQDCKHTTWYSNRSKCPHARDVSIACGTGAGIAQYVACAESPTPKPGCPNAPATMPSCSDAQLSASLYCVHCQQTTPVLCLATGKPCKATIGGVETVIQQCASYKPLGAPDLKCYSSITVRGAKLELEFDASPFWEASKASCTYQGRYRRDACNCKSQAVGGPRVLHRVSQPIFRDPCWRGGTPSDQLGVQTMCETFQWTGRRRMSGCSPEIIFPWCFAEFIGADGGKYWVLDHGCATPELVATSYISTPDDAACNLNCGWPLERHKNNKYCVYCNGNSSVGKLNICLVQGGNFCTMTTKIGGDIKVVECSKLPNSGVLQNGCPTAVNGTPLTAANQDVWPASQTLCAKRASKFY